MPSAFASHISNAPGVHSQALGVDDDRTHNPLPRLSNRSRSEVLFSSLFAQYIQQTDVHRILGSLCLGERLCNSDCAFQLPDGRIVVLEYDGGYWHGDSRVEQDVRKSRKVVGAQSNTWLVRIRTGNAAPFPLPDDIQERCLVVHSQETTVAKQFDDLKRAIQHDVRFNFLMGDPQRVDLGMANKMCNEVFSRCDATFKERLGELKRLVGTLERANQVLNVHGVTSNMHSVVTGLTRLRTEFGFDTKSLVSFMCNSVATRLSDETFWTSLARLRTEFGFDTKSLVSFMCDGVATRLSDETFWTSLTRLRTEFGFDTKSLVSFMSGSVATRLSEETFWTSLARLRTEFGDRPRQLGLKAIEQHKRLHMMSR